MIPAIDRVTYEEEKNQSGVLLKFFFQIELLKLAHRYSWS